MSYINILLKAKSRLSSNLNVIEFTMQRVMMTSLPVNIAKNNKVLRKLTVLLHKNRCYN